MFQLCNAAMCDLVSISKKWHWWNVLSMYGWIWRWKKGDETNTFNNYFTLNNQIHTEINQKYHFLSNLFLTCTLFGYALIPFQNSESFDQLQSILKNKQCKKTPKNKTWILQATIFSIHFILRLIENLVKYLLTMLKENFRTNHNSSDQKCEYFYLICIIYISE